MPWLFVLVCTVQLLEKRAPAKSTAVMPGLWHALHVPARLLGLLRLLRRQGIFQLPQNPATLASLTVTRHGGISH